MASWVDALPCTEVLRAGFYPQWDHSTSVVAFARRELFEQIVWHEHQHLELALVLEGGGLRGVGDVVEPCEDGDLCLTGEGTSHGCNGRGRPGGARAVVVHFTRAALTAAFATPELGLLRPMLERAGRGVIVGGHTRDTVVHQMLALAAAPRGSWRAVVLLLDALGTMADSRELRSVAPGDARPRGRLDARLRDVAQYIELSGLQGVCHREAAMRAKMSPSAFSRFFKRRLGRTFEDHVNELRIAEACRMLAETARPIIDIAFAVGFNNVAHFNRRFRRARGMTPTAHRARQSSLANAQ